MVIDQCQSVFISLDRVKLKAVTIFAMCESDLVERINSSSTQAHCAAIEAREWRHCHLNGHQFSCLPLEERMVKRRMFD